MRSQNSTTPSGPAGRSGLRRLALIAAAAAQLALPLATGTRADSTGQAPAPPCAIRGIAGAGPVRLPGVGITVTPKAGGTAVSTSTGIDGTYTAPVPGPGSYTVAADLTGFAAVTMDVVVDASCKAQQDLVLTLASRAEPSAPSTPATAAAPGPSRPADRRQAQAPAPFRGTVGTPAGAPGQPGAQSGQGGQVPQQAGASAADESLEAVAAQISLPPGFSVGTSGDSLTTSGSAGQVNPMLFMMTGPDGGPGGGQAAKGCSAAWAASAAKASPVHSPEWAASRADSSREGSRKAAVSAGRAVAWAAAAAGRAAGQAGAQAAGQAGWAASADAWPWPAAGAARTASACRRRTPCPGRPSTRRRTR